MQGGLATAASSPTGTAPTATTTSTQVGKLHYDIDPTAARDWRHRTATAINSENKSTALTAGHCVLDASTKRWYTDLWFYPRLRERRPPRCVAGPQFSTTHNWYTYGASADDMAVVVKRHSAGVPLVNRLRGQGITFNQSVGMMRTALGHPRPTYRWSGWTSSGSFAGQMVLGCSMTGGASGGPWLSNVPSTWLGTVMSVNSPKGWAASRGAPWMFGPYLGSQEAAVFQAYRAF